MRRAMNWRHWKLPRRRWKMCSSNLPEGGYAIDQSHDSDARAHATGAAKQDVFLLQRGHAARILFSIRRRLRQRRTPKGSFLSWPGAGIERDGQLLGTK